MDEKKFFLPAEPEETSLVPVDSPWYNLSPQAKRGMEISKQRQRTKHGLFANIPIVCKSSQCPYRETCAPYAYDCAPEGEPCVVEISLIEKLFEDYVSELQVDPTQIVNLGLIKSLIDAEVTVSRCDAILARDGDLLTDIVTGVTPQGRILTNKDAHPALGIRAQALKQRNDAYQLLNSTPKDKAKKDQTIIIDPSTYATRIMRKARELRAKREEEGITIDAEVTVRDESQNQSSAD